LQQAAEYISFLIAERKHLLEMNRQCIAATTTRCVAPVKRRKGSDGELSDDGCGSSAAPVYGPDHLNSSEARCKRRSPQNFDSPYARSSLPIKKRKDEVAHCMWSHAALVVVERDRIKHRDRLAHLLQMGGMSSHYFPLN